MRTFGLSVTSWIHSCTKMFGCGSCYIKLKHFFQKVKYIYARDKSTNQHVSPWLSIESPTNTYIDLWLSFAITVHLYDKLTAVYCRDNFLCSTLWVLSLPVSQSMNMKSTVFVCADVHVWDSKCLILFMPQCVSALSTNFFSPDLVNVSPVDT